MWNGTMFVDLDWPLNASSLLSASAELLVMSDDSKSPSFLWYCRLATRRTDVKAVKYSMQLSERVYFWKMFFNLAWLWCQCSSWKVNWWNLTVGNCSILWVWNSHHTHSSAAFAAALLLNVKDSHMYLCRNILVESKCVITSTKEVMFSSALVC